MCQEGLCPSYRNPSGNPPSREGLRYNEPPDQVWTRPALRRALVEGALPWLRMRSAGARQRDAPSADRKDKGPLGTSRLEPLDQQITVVLSEVDTKGNVGRGAGIMPTCPPWLARERFGGLFVVGPVSHGRIYSRIVGACWQCSARRRHRSARVPGRHPQAPRLHHLALRPSRGRSGGADGYPRRVARFFGEQGSVCRARLAARSRPNDSRSHDEDTSLHWR